MRFALPCLLATGCLTSDVETASLRDLRDLNLTISASPTAVLVEMRHHNIQPCPELDSAFYATVNDAPMRVLDRGHYEEEGCSYPRLRLDNPAIAETAKLVLGDASTSIQSQLGDALIPRVATRVGASDWTLPRGGAFTFSWSPATDLVETPPRVWLVNHDQDLRELLDATVAGDQVTATVPEGLPAGGMRLEIYMYGVAIESWPCVGARCELAHSQHAYQDVTLQ